MSRAPLTRRAGAAVVATCAALVLASCTQESDDPSGATAPEDGSGEVAEEPAAPPEPFTAALDLPRSGRAVPVDTVVRVGAGNGSLDAVSVWRGKRAPERMLSGRLSKDGGRWVADELLEPGVTYTVQSRGTSEAGESRTVRGTFTTESLTLDEQTYPSIAPLQGETVGVGMPVIVTFDIPVSDRAAVERRLSVDSQPAVTGTWHWMSDTEVHYRPKAYWPAGTDVSVDVGINGVDAGNGIYGQMDRSVDFRVGQSVISNVNTATHQMEVNVNGEVARTIPISAGKPGWDTRDGTKLIMEKFEVKRMDAATVGLSESDPEYYNIPDVEYAMRVTYSGEFLHAAPWSVASQGSANVSHGCVGMSTENAAWLYGISNRGDVVNVTGSGRPLEDGNGWTDWNMSWQEYRAGSALA